MAREDGWRERSIGLLTDMFEILLLLKSKTAMLENLARPSTMIRESPLKLTSASFPIYPASMTLTSNLNSSISSQVFESAITLHFEAEKKGGEERRDLELRTKLELFLRNLPFRRL